MGALHFPARFHLEDATAAAHQRRHRVTLVAVGVVAILLEVISWWSNLVVSGNWFWVSRTISVVVILVLGFEVVMSASSKTEVPWYEARAAAESIKTVYWRYLMRAEPFGAELERSESENLLFERIEAVLTGLGKSAGERESIIEKSVLDWAWGVRNLPLAERVAMYVRERIEDQARWYEGKSRALDRYARRASRIVVLAVTAALALSIGAFRFSASGSWSEVSLEIGVVVFGYAAIRRFNRDARVYAFTLEEIRDAASRIPPNLTQFEWVSLVDEIEEVFSREHVTWQASHSGW